ncbi:Rhodanese domain-containing protein [Trichoderma simmonsii]|uniref:Rhodanese domain-containing protein n=1 Tax=Trichoderma simmonsii TaxID=1491479 RepID=A0A8G0PF57_9HYPO|nr:Rhodanese domain-containing protein [Trichoderma simmonsii]
MASSEQQGSSILAFEEIPPSDVSCAVIEPSDVYEWIEHTKAAGDHARKDFLLVDVRRNDWEGGTIATSVNLPAQSFYPTRPGVYQLCKQAGIKKVIFYCGSCGSRGPKCAGWFQEYLNSIGETEMTAAILRGGVKGWQKTYNGQNMDHYDPNAWGSQSK